jgi:hypothetical protein
MDAAKFLDLYEAEQLRRLQLDPRERAMQANYQQTMHVLYGMREMLAALNHPSEQ